MTMTVATASGRHGRPCHGPGGRVLDRDQLRPPWLVFGVEKRNVGGGARVCVKGEARAALFIQPEAGEGAVASINAGARSEARRR